MKLFYVTFPDDATRERIANDVMDDRLAGCIVSTSVDSLYIWDDETQEDDEVAALFKTSEARADELVTRIEAEHPYDVPCIIEIPAASTQDYDLWLHDVTRGVIDYSDGADETVLVRFDVGPIFQVDRALSVDAAVERIRTPDVSTELRAILETVLELQESGDQQLIVNGEVAPVDASLAAFDDEPVHIALP